MTDVRKGRCFCGAISFEFDGAPNWIAYCHCDSCRRATSSPVTAYVGVPYTAFRYVSGTPETYQSTPGVRRSFCGSCGSQLAFESDKYPGEIHLFVVTLDNQEALAPRGHVHTGEQLSWFEVDDALPRFDAAGIGNKPTHFGPKRSRGRLP